MTFASLWEKPAAIDIYLLFEFMFRSARGNDTRHCFKHPECLQLTVFCGCANRENVKPCLCFFEFSTEGLAGALGERNSRSSSCVSHDIMFSFLADRESDVCMLSKLALMSWLSFCILSIIRKAACKLFGCSTLPCLWLKNELEIATRNRVCIHLVRLVSQSPIKSSVKVGNILTNRVWMRRR